MKLGSTRAFEMKSKRSLEADLDLAQSAASGDEQAQRTVIDLVIDRVSRTISYLVGGGDEAQDLTQVALVEIVRSLGSYRSECPLEQWADRVAVRATSKQLRKKIRRRRLRNKERAFPVFYPSLEDNVERRRMKERISKLLLDLSIDKRTALVLHYLHGYEVAEVATITGAKVNTVRGRLRAARKWMRERSLRDPILKQWIEGGSDES